MENQQVIGGSKRIVAVADSPLPSSTNPNNDHHIGHQVFYFFIILGS